MSAAGPPALPCPAPPRPGRPPHVADAELAQHHALPHLVGAPPGRHLRGAGPCGGGRAEEARGRRPARVWLPLPSLPARPPHTRWRRRHPARAALEPSQRRRPPRLAAASAAPAMSAPGPGPVAAGSGGRSGAAEWGGFEDNMQVGPGGRGGSGGARRGADAVCPGAGRRLRRHRHGEHGRHVGLQLRGHGGDAPAHEGGGGGGRRGGGRRGGGRGVPGREGAAGAARPAGR